MKSVLAFLGGLAIVFGSAAAHARGGGAHYVFIPIIIPGRTGPPQPFTPNPGVDLPLELTDAPVERTEGVIGLHEAIARHTIRAADAIVVEQPIEGGRRAIPAGTVLAKVYLTTNGQQTTLWCDMRTFGGGGDSRFDCLSDSQGTGKVDSQWSSLTSDEFLGFGGDEDIKFKRRMENPASFHEAKPEERPTGMIGYEWCGGDAVTQPPRFEVSATFSGGYWEESETHACPFGEWADATKTTVSVDAIKVEVKPGPKPNTLAFKVDGRIAPELIAHLEPGGPIRSRAAASGEAAIDQSALVEQSLMPTGAPAHVASGPISKGDTIYSIGARHGITGVLTSDVWLGKYVYFHQAQPPDAPSLKVGQIIYARTVADADAVHIVWCAPRKSDSGHWTDAVCLPTDGTGYVWIEAKPAMLVGTLLIPEALRPYATPPIVRRQPVDLPPMTLSYVFRGWSKGAANIDAQVDWGEGPQSFKTTALSAGANGAADLPVASGKILIRPGATPEDADVQFQASPSSGPHGG